MGMTKKDYELIAKVIKGRKSNHNKLYFLNRTPKEIELANNVVDDLARFLEYELIRNNKNFDGGRFLESCGVEIRS